MPSHPRQRRRRSPCCRPVSSRGRSIDRSVGRRAAVPVRGLIARGRAMAPSQQSPDLNPRNPCIRFPPSEIRFSDNRIGSNRRRSDIAWMRMSTPPAERQIRSWHSSDVMPSGRNFVKRINTPPHEVSLNINIYPRIISSKKRVDINTSDIVQLFSSHMG